MPNIIYNSKSPRESDFSFTSQDTYKYFYSTILAFTIPGYDASNLHSIFLNGTASPKIFPQEKRDCYFGKTYICMWNFVITKTGFPKLIK